MLRRAGVATLLALVLLPAAIAFSSTGGTSGPGCKRAKDGTFHGYCYSKKTVHVTKTKHVTATSYTTLTSTGTVSVAGSTSTVQGTVTDTSTAEPTSTVATAPTATVTST